MKVYSNSADAVSFKYVRLSDMEQTVRNSFLEWLGMQTTAILHVDGVELGDAIEYEEFKKFLLETVPNK